MDTSVFSLASSYPWETRVWQIFSIPDRRTWKSRSLEQLLCFQIRSPEETADTNTGYILRKIYRVPDGEHRPAEPSVADVRPAEECERTL